MKPTTRHQFTATIQIISDKPDVDRRTGFFGGKDDPQTWAIVPQERHTAHLAFLAPDSAIALNTVHRLMQRHARGKSDPRNYRKKRARYGPEDYAVLELIHPQIGKADLPRGNVLPKKVRGPKTETMEFAFQ